MTKTNWMEVSLTPVDRLQMFSIKKLLQLGMNKEALEDMKRLRATHSKNDPQIDMSGLHSVIVLFENDQQNETGYFDPVDPLVIGQ